MILFTTQNALLSGEIALCYLEHIIMKAREDHLRALMNKRKRREKIVETQTQGEEGTRS